MQNKNYIKYAKPGVIMLGFISLAIQIIVLREFLTLFNGNELVIGIILANWMLLTGFGAYLGKFIGKKNYKDVWNIIILGLLSFIPIVTVLVLHFAWYSMFTPGMMAGITHVFYYSFIILSPFCILSGILFTQFSRLESLLTNHNKIGEVYAWESMGSLIGGILVNFVLIWIATTFQSLFLLMVVMVLVTFYLGIKSNHFVLSGLVLIVSFIFGFLFMKTDFDKHVRALAFPSQEIVYTSDSPYGIFAITKHGDQLNYYENNILMASSGDVISNEESVHFAMIQHKKPENILVLSGFISGIMEEINEYPVKTVDYVDLNPEIIKTSRQALDNKTYHTLTLIENDPVRYLKKNNKKYDVVLINFPKPSTIQLNRYYTQEFFELLKKNLSQDAVISLSMPSSANYLGDKARRLLSIIYKTLKTEFKNVLILPASSDFLIASDSNLDYHIAQKIEQCNIPTEYVNSYFFDDELIHLRSEQLHKQLDDKVLVNKDFSPVFYQSQLQLWMSRFNIKYWIPAIIILLFSGFFFIKASRIYKGIFAAGFAGTSIEIILLLVFQVVFGYVYAVVGIFIMIFMGGLAFGSYYVPTYFKEINKRSLSKILLVISIYAFFLPVVFFLFKSVELNDVILLIIFALLLFIISLLTGAVFSLACKINTNDYGTIASSAYGLDLLGAATGALLFTIYFIPVLGFGWSVVVVGMFNLFMAILNKDK